MDKNLQSAKNDIPLKPEIHPKTNGGSPVIYPPAHMTEDTLLDEETIAAKIKEREEQRKKEIGSTYLELQFFQREDGYIEYIRNPLNDLKISSKLGTMLSEFLKMDEKTMLKELSDADYPQDEVHPYFSMDAVKSSFQRFGEFPFLEMQERIVKYFSICKKNDIKIDIASFSAFMSAYQMKIPLHAFGHVYSEEESKKLLKIPKNEIDVQLEEILKMSQYNDFVTHDIYLCSTSLGQQPILEQVCTATIYYILNNKKTFAQCISCGRWFVPINKSDEKLCDFSNPTYPEKTCKEASKLLHQLKREKFESVKIYKSISAMKKNKVNTANLGEDYEKALKEYEQFISNAKEFKELMSKGEKTEEEYISWLKTHYSHKHKKNSEDDNNKKKILKSR